MPTTLRLKPPEDFELARDVCSYGYFLVAPNSWDVKARAFSRTLEFERLPVRVRITQPRGAGSALVAAFSRTLSSPTRARATQQLSRMLRLDESAGEIGEFHRVDPRWRRSGRGRLFRSPTLFEDIIKTITSCNVTWPGTLAMNRRLCEVLGVGKDGEQGFPSVRTLAGTRAVTLRARCRTGYRDERIVEIARRFGAPRASGGIDARWFEDPGTSDEAIHGALLELPGVGPYAAANIMQLLGRYSRLPLDTESVRHGKTVLGMKGTPAQIMKKVHAHFAPFGRHAFRSYWFELWSFYERKHGPAWTWERDSTGKMFTAAMLNK